VQDKLALQEDPFMQIHHFVKLAGIVLVAVLLSVGVAQAGETDQSASPSPEEATELPPVESAPPEVDRESEASSESPHTD